MLQNYATGQCLGGLAAGQVFTTLCERGDAHQIWIIADYGTTDAVDGAGRFTFRNAATGRCLQIYRGSGTAVPGLDTGSCAVDDPAKIIDGVGDGFSSVSLRGWHDRTNGSAICAASDSTGRAYARTCDGGADQRWRRR
ncbi:RICIN domain-containing protein [Micromonospora sp. NPDC050795]|uniref:RICIN domain-containing protein n=1 Tax=Micromonospora sp. NPDC050795 TaxID=3364282 RepID=UPI0037886F59